MVIDEHSIFASETTVQDVFRALMKYKENLTCFDCGDIVSNWTSVPCAVMLCIECSEKHKSFDAKFSFIKSSVQYQWTLNNLRRYKYGGNHMAREYFLKHDGERILRYDTDIHEKYSSHVVRRYIHHLDKKVEEDIEKFRYKFVLGSVEDNNDSTESVVSVDSTKNGNNKDDDFFGTWLKKKRDFPLKEELDLLSPLKKEIISEPNTTPSRRHSILPQGSNK